MHCTFTLIESTDGLKLPGLLFAPLKNTKHAAIWLHGMGDNGVFYAPERTNAIATQLTKSGIAFLAFNNRGAHNIKHLSYVKKTDEERKYYQGGTFYEKIIDCVFDIDGAVSFLKKQGYNTFSLIGHSSGANKICVYDYHKTKNPFTKYIMLGAGDDTGIHFAELGENKFWSALKLAEHYIAQGKEQKTMPHYSGMYPFSAISTYDLLNPNGSYNTFPFFESTTRRLGTKRLFLELSKISKPTSFIYGQNDEYTFTANGSENALRIIQKHTNKAIQSDYHIIPDADHGFHDHYNELATSIVKSLNEYQ